MRLQSLHRGQPMPISTDSCFQSGTESEFGQQSHDRGNRKIASIRLRRGRLCNELLRSLLLPLLCHFLRSEGITPQHTRVARACHGIKTNTLSSSLKGILHHEESAMVGVGDPNLTTV